MSAATGAEAHPVDDHELLEPDVERLAQLPLGGHRHDLEDPVIEVHPDHAPVGVDVRDRPGVDGLPDVVLQRRT